MRVMIWMPNDKVDEVLGKLVDIGFLQDMTWGDKGFSNDMVYTDEIVVVGEFPDDKLSEFELMDDVKGWSPDFSHQPVKAATPETK